MKGDKREEKQGKAKNKDKSKGKKRKQEPEVVDAAAAEAAARGKLPKGGTENGDTAVQSGADGEVVQHDAAEDDMPAQPGQPTGGRSRSTVSLVPTETAKYLAEIVGHFKSLVDEEEKQLLLSNVLEEVRGKEQLVAGDPVCSRHMEVLLQAASTQQLLAFLSAALDTGGLAQLAVSPFGSHVAEKVLIQLGNAHDGMDTEEYEQFSKLLERLTQEVCESLWSFMTDRFATHVARRLLCLLCGSNILSPGSRGPTPNGAPKGGPGEGDGEEGDVEQHGRPHAKQSAALGTAVGGLAAKVGVGKGAAQDELRPCRFPAQVEAMLRVLCREDYAGSSMWELVSGRYASPFIQAALRAATTLPNSRNMLTSLVPAVLGATYFLEGSAAKQGKVLEGVSEEGVASMCEDAASSHVLEVVCSVASGVPGLLDELLGRFFQGQLKQRALHPTANFVVQAVLAACTTPTQVAPLYEELGPVIGELLRRRRAGVVAALVAACARAGCCHKELCGALAAALTAHPPWAGQPASKVLAAALLCLDSTGATLVTGSSSNEMPVLSSLVKGARGPPKLSTLGGAILINVLKLQQGACRDFTDSLVGMSPGDLARVGYDPAGARALESLIDSSAPAKVKQKLLAGLQGGWAVVASSGSGRFFLEKCYALAEGEMKEAIVRELVAAEQHVNSLHWGPRLLARVGADTYKRDPGQWRRAAHSSTKALAQFAELFGGEVAHAAAAGVNKQRGQHTAGGKAAATTQQQQQEEVEEAQEQQQQGGGGKLHKKKQGQKRAHAGEEEEEQPAQAAEEEAAHVNGQSQKHSKKAQEHCQQGDAAGPAEPQEASRKGKKRKQQHQLLMDGQQGEEGHAGGAAAAADGEDDGAAAHGAGIQGPGSAAAAAVKQEAPKAAPKGEKGGKGSQKKRDRGTNGAAGTGAGGDEIDELFAGALGGKPKKMKKVKQEVKHEIKHAIKQEVA